MRPALLLAVLLALPEPASAASYDCTLPTLTPNERAICQTRDLNDMDVEMATMFRLLSGLFGMGMRGAMQDDQRVWLQTRMACGPDAACIRHAYRQRIDALQAIYDGIDRPI
ncbi:lysozyme inhibitor LprI family protein [Pararhodobacter aggregans]|uniref:lysozyme inhibitor LprI family protein n=1 Tax=Pararhodobacter aggregans TaxID=404875 RepID=UPI003A8F25DE